MKRYIKDYSSITDEHMMLIRQSYPNGFDEHDLIALKSPNGGYFNCLEVKTPDAIYLLKVNHNLLEKIDKYDRLVDRKAALGDEDIAGELEGLA